MKLLGQSLALQLLVNRVDAVSDDERGTGGALGEEVTHRTVERARHAHRLAIAREQGEGAFDGAHALRIIRQHAGARLLDAEIVETVERGVGEIHDAFDVFRVHGASVAM